MTHNTRECPYCQGHDCPECDALTHDTREVEEWEKEFDKKFDFFECAELNGVEIKLFIHHQLQKAREEGILQGKLYGYDIILKAPSEAVDDIINNHTLENYIANTIQEALQSSDPLPTQVTE